MAKESRRDELLAGLREEQKRIAGQLQELDAERQRVLEELAGVEGAIASMTGQKKPPKGRRKKSGKGGATTEEVLGHVRAVLGELETATEQDLRAKVGDRVAAAGQSKSGLHIQLKRVLAGDEFAREGEKVSLAQ